MADVLMGKTEVDNVSQETVLGAMVQQLLIQESICMPLISMYPAGPGEDLLKIPNAGRFTVNDKLENTAVDAQAITYSTDNLALDKHKVIQVLLEDFAQLQSKVAAVQDIAMRAGKELALQVDKDIITQLKLASAAAPDHRIAYVGAAIAKEDILAAKELLDLQSVSQSDRYMLVSPGSYNDLLAIGDFVRADALGMSKIPSGALGKIFGIDVFMHTEVADAETLVFHKSAVAMGLQQVLRAESDRDLPNLATRFSFSQVYGVKVLDSGKRQILLGTAV